MVKTPSGYSTFSLVKVLNKLYNNKERGIVVKSYILVLAFLVLGFNSYAQSPLKIGYVDSEVILTQFSESIKAQGDLDALTNKWSAQLDSMTLAYQQSIADYQKQVETMNEAKKTEAQQKLLRWNKKLWNLEKLNSHKAQVKSIRSKKNYFHQ